MERIVKNIRLGFRTLIILSLVSIAFTFSGKDTSSHEVAINEIKLIIDNTIKGERIPIVEIIDSACIKYSGVQTLIMPKAKLQKLKSSILDINDTKLWLPMCMDAKREFSTISEFTSFIEDRSNFPFFLGAPNTREYLLMFDEIKYDLQGQEYDYIKIENISILLSLKNPNNEDLKYGIDYNKNYHGWHQPKENGATMNDYTSSSLLSTDYLDSTVTYQAYLSYKYGLENDEQKTGSSIYNYSTNEILRKRSVPIGMGVPFQKEWLIQKLDLQLDTITDSPFPNINSLEDKIGDMSTSEALRYLEEEIVSYSENFQFLGMTMDKQLAYWLVPIITIGILLHILVNILLFRYVIRNLDKAEWVSWPYIYEQIVFTLSFDLILISVPLCSFLSLVFTNQNVHWIIDVFISIIIVSTSVLMILQMRKLRKSYSEKIMWTSNQA